MQPSIAQARPPFVDFETRSEEDRAASVEAGHYVGQDVDFALITPMGSKDRIERRVQEWFRMLEEQVAEGRFEASWLDQYKAHYKAWKSGQDIPVSGTPVRTWPALSATQVKTLLSARVHTVEDLASANEETLHRIGMGARALKDRAIEWLSAAASVGRTAEELAALKVANADLAARNDELTSQLRALMARLEEKAAPAARKL